MNDDAPGPTSTADFGRIDRFTEALVERLGEAAQSVVVTDDLAPYLTDFWRQNVGRSRLVLRPRSVEEVCLVVQLADRFEIGLVPQGGNTGLVGGGIPDQTGGLVVLSLERLNRIREIDDAGDFLIAEAGCVLADVQAAAAEAGRLFPLSLGSEGSCRIGGNLSTNAGGVNVLRYGMARQLVMGLEVVLADGQVWHGLRALKKDNTGYDLKQLFIGAEGSLGIITAAVLRLFPIPRETRTLWLTIRQPADAIALLKIFQADFGELISSFELLTGFGVEAAARHLPGVRYPVETRSDWHLLIEIASPFPDGLGDPVEAVVATAFDRDLVTDGTLALNEEQRAMMWRIREGQSEATRHMGYIIRSDISVKVRDLPVLIRRAGALFGASDPAVTLIPFGHVGDGNLHFNFVAPEDTPDMAGMRARLLGRLADLVADLNGSFSAEHGVGRFKRDELARRKAPLDLTLMRRLKSSFDPKNILNPGVILEP